MFTLQKRLARLRESGQGTIEYLGIAVCISVLIASLSVSMTPVGQNLGSSIQKVICQIASHVPGGGECSQYQERDPEDYMPVCVANSTSQYHGSTVDVAWFTLGAGTKMKVEKLSDGTARVTLLDDGTFGGNYEVGKAKFNEWAKFNLGAGIDVTASLGDQWQFDSWEEAEAFAKANEERVDHWSNNIPIPFLQDPFNPHKKPKDPRTTTFEVDMTEWGEGSLLLNVDQGSGKKQKDNGSDQSGKQDSKPDGDAGDTSNGEGTKPPQWKSRDHHKEDGTKFDPNGTFSSLLPGGELQINKSASGVFTYDRGDDLSDPDDDIRSFTVEVGQGGNGRLGGFGGGLEGAAEGKTAFTYRQNAKGEVIGVTISQESRVAGSVSRGPNADKTVLYQANLDLTDPAARQTFADFVQNPGGLPDLSKIKNGEITPALTPEQQEMYELLRSPAVTLTETHYDNERSGDGVDFAVKVGGIGVGYGNSTEQDSSQVTDAYAYVPNDSGGYDRVRNTNCVPDSSTM